MSAVASRLPSHQSLPTDLEASRARARSLALDADPKAAEMRRFLRSHTHEQRLRSAAGLRGSSEAAAAVVAAREQASVSDHVNLLRRLEDDARGAEQPPPPGGCLARLAWRGELDRQVSRLLQDGEALLDPWAPLKEADRHRLRCSHLDRVYGWFSKHGRKEAAKERLGPDFLLFDPDQPPQPGSLRRGPDVRRSCPARAERAPTAAAPSCAPPAVDVRRPCPAAPPMEPLPPPLPASPPAAAWLARAPQRAAACPAPARRRAPSALPPLQGPPAPAPPPPEGPPAPALPPAEAPADPAPLTPAALPKKVSPPAVVLARSTVELAAGGGVRREVFAAEKFSPPTPLRRRRHASTPPAGPSTAPPPLSEEPEQADVLEPAWPFVSYAAAIGRHRAEKPTSQRVEALRSLVAAAAARQVPPEAPAEQQPSSSRRSGRGGLKGSQDAKVPPEAPAEQQPSSSRRSGRGSLRGSQDGKVPPEAPAEQQPSSSRRSGRGSLRGSQDGKATAAALTSARRAKSVGALDRKVLRDRGAMIRASAHAGC